MTKQMFDTIALERGIQQVKREAPALIETLIKKTAKCGSWRYFENLILTVNGGIPAYDSPGTPRIDFQRQLGWTVRILKQCAPVAWAEVARRLGIGETE